MDKKNMPQDPLVDEWRARASDDERSIDAIIKEEGGAPNTACFLSQQMAEKLLKAYLVFRQGTHARVHALDALWEQCRAHEASFDDIKEACAHLSAFYVTARYPGDYPDFSWEDAREAQGEAMRVKNFVYARLRKR